jgi:hypothetical protein
MQDTFPLRTAIIALNLQRSKVHINDLRQPSHPFLERQYFPLQMFWAAIKVAVVVCHLFGLLGCVCFLFVVHFIKFSKFAKVTKNGY